MLRAAVHMARRRREYVICGDVTILGAWWRHTAARQTPARHCYTQHRHMFGWRASARHMVYHNDDEGVVTRALRVEWQYAPVAFQRLLWYSEKEQ